MTSKLKCPFCETELEQMHDKKLLGCPKCLHIADGAFWAKAIQAKQDLEIVVDALKPFADRGNWDFEHCFVDNPQLLAEKALEQIGLNRN